MSGRGSPIEKAVAVLTELEKALDDLALEVAAGKRKLLAMAREEAEAAKAAALEAAAREAEKLVADADAEASRESEAIISRAKKSAEALRSRIQEVREKAVALVVKEILGED